MVIISVLISVPTQDQEDFPRRWRDVFLPAIRRWPGFARCDLLAEWPRESDAPRETPRFRLDIVFDSEEQRQAWAASPEHAVAFGALTQGVTLESSMRMVPADVV